MNCKSICIVLTKSCHPFECFCSYVVLFFHLRVAVRLMTTGILLFNIAKATVRESSSRRSLKIPMLFLTLVLDFIPSKTSPVNTHLIIRKRVVLPIPLVPKILVIPLMSSFMLFLPKAMN